MNPSKLNIKILIAGMWHNPLLRNGYALVAAVGITAVLGLFYWFIAARTLPAADVGIGAALVSAMMTVSNIGQLNLSNVMNRYLPGSGNRAGRLIAFAYAAAILATAVLALAFLGLLGYFAPNLQFLRDSMLLSLVFVGSTCLWSWCTLQDAALTGLRQSSVVMVENTTYAVVKLIFLIVSTWLLASPLSVYWAWIAPTPIMAILASAYVYKCILPKRQPMQNESALPGFRDLAQFWGYDYLGTTSFLAAVGIAPLIVLKYCDLASVAQYHLSWTISFTLYQIGRAMGSSLVTESMTNSAAHARHLRQTIKFTMIPLAAAVVVVVGAAPLVMALFGPDYVSGVPLLRLLALSCLPAGLTSLLLANARVHGHLKTIAGIQLLGLLSIFAIGLSLVPPFGAIGMAWTWLLTNSLTLLAMLILYQRSGTFKLNNLNKLI